MPDLAISIGGREFEVSCQEGEEHFLRMAAGMLDREAGVLVGQIGRLPDLRMLLMAGLMVADKAAGMEDQLRQVQGHMAAQETRSAEIMDAVRAEVMAETRAAQSEAFARAESSGAELDAARREIAALRAENQALLDAGVAQEAVLQAAEAAQAEAEALRAAAQAAQSEAEEILAGAMAEAEQIRATAQPAAVAMIPDEVFAALEALAARAEDMADAVEDAE